MTDPITKQTYTYGGFTIQSDKKIKNISKYVQYSDKEPTKIKINGLENIQINGTTQNDAIVLSNCKKVNVYGDEGNDNLYLLNSKDINFYGDARLGVQTYYSNGKSNPYADKAYYDKTSNLANIFSMKKPDSAIEMSSDAILNMINGNN